MKVLFELLKSSYVGQIWNKITFSKTFNRDVRFEVFKAEKIQVEFFWIMTPRNVVYDINVSKDFTASIFREKLARSSEMFVSYRNITRRHNPEDHGLNFSTDPQ
jgi:hypothetical protein